MDSIDEHPASANSSIDSTESGTVNACNDEAPLKAYPAIEAMPSFKLISSRLAQLWKDPNDN